MVFKKLLSAGNNAANVLMLGPEQAGKIRQLEAMGFPPERARHALNATDGNVDRAAELLLLSADEPQPSRDAVAPVLNSGTAADRDGAAAAATGNDYGRAGPAVAAHNEEQMRRAIEESLRVNQQEESRQLRQAEAASMGNSDLKKEVVDLTGGGKAEAKTPSGAKKQNRPAAKQPASKQRDRPATTTAAAINAGKAAAARHNHKNTTTTSAKGTLDQTHPDVKVPQKFSNKSKEEQIMRCAHRLKPHIMAVDTLLRVLTFVRDAPGNPKFRIIDRANANYVAFVRDAPGAEDLLLAMNYRRIPCNDELRLERHLVDETLLFLGISALEQMRATPEYQEGKRLRAFHAEMRRVARGNGGGVALQRAGMSEGETAVRLAFLARCPKEPPEGRGARVSVQLGEESENIPGGRVDRRFDGDDTLEDVLNWLGGCYGNEVLEKIRGHADSSGGSVREWCLCDLNCYPMLPLDVEKHKKNTLQYLGLFPSGKLGVRLSEDTWRVRSEGGDASGGTQGFGYQGSARGLGAASRSMLH